MLFLIEAVIGCILFTVGVAVAMRNPLAGVHTEQVEKSSSHKKGETIVIRESPLDWEKLEKAYDVWKEKKITAKSLWAL